MSSSSFTMPRRPFEHIPRSAYPFTRDQQAMQRFMEGTLNVGHHMTFQRKGKIVNVFPLPSQRDTLVKFFDVKNVHRNERCYNAKLNFRDAPFPPEMQLCRELEFQVFPYDRAEITLTPAEYISENGKRRNMHMQTHKDLDNAPTVHLFGIGQRKGQLALLQMVKDAFDFNRDRLRDAAEEAALAAARNARPFVRPYTPDVGQQWLSYPADPSRRVRDLFETQSQQATTPSDVAIEAQQAVMRLQNGSYQFNNPVIERSVDHSNINPSNTMIRPRQETDVFSSARTDVAQGENENHIFKQNIFHSSFGPIRNRRNLANLSHSPRMNVTLDPLQAAAEAGMIASKKIFVPSIENANGKRVIPQLPNAKYFLDLERGRLMLRNAKVPVKEVYEAWQNRHKNTHLPSWGTSVQSTPRANKSTETEQTDLVNDSGVLLNGNENEFGQESLSNLQPVDAISQANWEASIDEFSFRMISPERPSPKSPSFHSASSHISHKESNLDQAQTPHMSAASTLLSLSPFKSFDSNTTI